MAINFGFWGSLAYVIKHAKFQLNWFRVDGATGAKNRHSPLNSGIVLTTMYALKYWTLFSVHDTAYESRSEANMIVEYY